MELVTVCVGKNGVSPKLIDEIKSVLVKRKKMRVKFLKSCLQGSDRVSLAEDIKAKTKARNASIRGNTVILEQ